MDLRHGLLIKLSFLLVLLLGAFGVVGFFSNSRSSAQETPPAAIFDQADLDQLKSIGTAYFADKKNAALRDELKAFGEHLEQKYSIDGTRWCIHTNDGGWLPYQCVQ